MLSRFFVSAKQQQQQPPQPPSNGLGDVDALDQAARDPRHHQAPVPPPAAGSSPHTTLGKSNDDDDDDESSAANMSFLDHDTDDDDGTVDTTNSGMVLDMVKNSFLQGLVDGLQNHPPPPPEEHTTTGDDNDDDDKSPARSPSEDDNDRRVDDGSAEEEEDDDDDPEEDDDDDQDDEGDVVPNGVARVSNSQAVDHEDDDDHDDDDDDHDDDDYHDDDSRQVNDRHHQWDNDDDDNDSHEMDNDDDDDDRRRYHHHLHQDEDYDSSSKADEDDSRRDDENDDDDDDDDDDNGISHEDQEEEEEDSDAGSYGLEDDDDKEAEEDDTPQPSAAVALAPPPPRFGWALPRATHETVANPEKEEEEEQEQDGDSSIRQPPQLRFGWNTRRTATIGPAAAPPPAASAETTTPPPITPTAAAAAGRRIWGLIGIAKGSISSENNQSDRSENSSNNNNGGGGRVEESTTHKNDDAVEAEQFAEESSSSSSSSSLSDGEQSHSHSKSENPAKVSENSPGPATGAALESTAPNYNNNNFGSSSGSIVSSSTEHDAARAETVAQVDAVVVELATRTDDVGDNDNDEPSSSNSSTTGSSSCVHSADETSEPKKSGSVAVVTTTTALPRNNGNVSTATDAVHGPPAAVQQEISPPRVVPAHVDDETDDASPAVIPPSIQPAIIADERRNQMKKQKSWFDVLVSGEEDDGNDNQEATVPEQPSQPDHRRDIMKKQKSWFDVIVSGEGDDGSDNQEATIPVEPKQPDDRRNQIKKQKSWFDVIVSGEVDDDSDNKDAAVPEPIAIIAQASKGWFDSIIAAQPNTSERLQAEASEASPEYKAEETNRRTQVTRSKSWLETVFVNEAAENPHEESPESAKTQDGPESDNVDRTNKPQEVKPKGWFDSILLSEAYEPGSNSANATESSLEQDQNAADRRKGLTRSKSWLESVFVGDDDEQVGERNVALVATERSLAGSALEKVKSAVDPQKDSVPSKGNSEQVQDCKQPDFEASERLSVGSLADSARPPLKKTKSWLESTLMGDDETSENRPEKASSAPTDRRSDFKRTKSWLDVVFSGDDDHCDEDDSRQKEKYSKSWQESVLTGEGDTGATQSSSEIRHDVLPCTNHPEGKSESVTLDETGLSETQDLRTEANAKSVDQRPDLKRSKRWLKSVIDNDGEAKAAEETKTQSNNPAAKSVQGNMTATAENNASTANLRPGLKASKSWQEALMDSSGEKEIAEEWKPPNDKAVGKCQTDAKQDEVTLTAEKSPTSAKNQSEQATAGRASIQRSKSWLESVLGGEEEENKDPTSCASNGPPRRELTRSNSWLSLVLGDEVEDAVVPDYLKETKDTLVPQASEDPSKTSRIEQEAKPFRFEKSKGPKPTTRADKPEDKEEKSSGSERSTVEQVPAPPAQSCDRQIGRSKSWLDSVLLRDQETSGDDQMSYEERTRADVAKDASHRDAKQPEQNHQKSWLESVLGIDGAKIDSKESSPARNVAQSATLKLTGDFHKKLKAEEHEEDENISSMDKMFKEDEPVVIELTSKKKVQSEKPTGSEPAPAVTKTTSTNVPDGSTLGNQSNGPVSKTGHPSTEVVLNEEEKLRKKAIKNATKKTSRLIPMRFESVYAKRALLQAISTSSYKTSDVSKGTPYCSGHTDLKALSITKAIFGKDLEQDVASSHEELMLEGMDDDMPDYLRVGPVDDMPDYLRVGPVDDMPDYLRTGSQSTIAVTSEPSRDGAVKVQGEDEGSESQSSESGCSPGDESADNGKTDTIGKTAASLAPMFRLQNVTQATRNQLPEVKPPPETKTEKATSRWKTLFRRAETVQAFVPQQHAKQEEDLIESEPSEDSKDDSSELDSDDSLSNGLVDNGEEIKEVMESVQEESQSEPCDENGVVDGNLNRGTDIHRDPGKEQAENGPTVVKAAEVHGVEKRQDQVQAAPSTGDADELSKRAASLLQALTPEDIQKIAGQIAAQPNKSNSTQLNKSNTVVTAQPTKQPASPTKNKKKNKKSISSLLDLSNARQVGRHGDEMSVGTMNIAKKTVQNGRMVVVAKTNGLVFDEHGTLEQVKRRPWDLAMQKGPKKQLHDLDPDNEEELLKVEILAKSEEFFGCGPTGLHATLPVLAATIEESDEEEAEAFEDDDETVPKQSDEPIIAVEAEEDFTEIWDTVSCDESIAVEFMRTQQKKNHEREKKRQRREQLKEERANASKRLRVFERSKDTLGSTKRGAKKSKLSEEFIDAIHRVFEEDSNGSLRSGSDESDSDDSLGSNLSGSCKSIYMDEKVDKQCVEEVSLSSQSNHSNDSRSKDMDDEKVEEEEEEEEDNNASRGSHKDPRQRKRKKRKRGSLRHEVDSSDMFLKEIERLTAPKVLTIQTLRQEMIDRRGTSVNLLKKEYVNFKKKRSEKKPSHDEVQPIDFGALSAQRRRSSFGKENNNENGPVEEKSQPGIGLAEKLSRWALAEGVTDLDDLATVTHSPVKNINMFGVQHASAAGKSTSVTSVAPSMDKNAITPRGPKSYGAAATTVPQHHTSRPAAAPGTVTNSARRAVPRARAATDELGGGTGPLFAANFINEAPMLNSIQESSLDDEDEFGLLTNLRGMDGGGGGNHDDDDKSYFSSSSKRSSNHNNNNGRFKMGAKVGLKMKMLVPKLPAMNKGARGRQGSSGFMLSDND